MDSDNNIIIPLSECGAAAKPFLSGEIPSEYVPFRGKFPLLGEAQMRLYSKEIKKTDNIDDCPEWVRTAVLTGYDMYTLDCGFRAWLRDNGLLSGWSNMKKEPRARYVAMWMNAGCLDPLRLNIAPVVPAAV